MLTSVQLESRIYANRNNEEKPGSILLFIYLLIFWCAERSGSLHKFPRKTDGIMSDSFACLSERPCGVLLHLGLWSRNTESCCKRIVVVSDAVQQDFPLNRSTRSDTLRVCSCSNFMSLISFFQPKYTRDCEH